MNDSFFYPIIMYGWLITHPLFLFGAIKLNKTKTSLGRRLLVIGFGLLTIHAVITLAQYLELYVVHYNPNYEITGSGTIWVNTYDGIDLDKWSYWGIFATRCLGYMTAACGFFCEIRRRQTNIQQGIHHPPLKHEQI